MATTITGMIMVITGRTDIMMAATKIIRTTTEIIKITIMTRNMKFKFKKVIMVTNKMLMLIFRLMSKNRILMSKLMCKLMVIHNIVVIIGKTGVNKMAGMITSIRRMISMNMMTFIITITLMTGKMMKRPTTIGTITKITDNKTKKTNTEEMVSNNNSKIKRTNIGTNKMKKTCTTVPEVIEFNTVTKVINTGTNKTNTMTSLIGKMTLEINKRKIGNTILTGNAIDAKFATSMMNSVAREAISSKDIMTGEGITINA